MEDVTGVRTCRYEHTYTCNITIHVLVLNDSKVIHSMIVKEGNAYVILIKGSRMSYSKASLELNYECMCVVVMPGIIEIFK